MTLLSGLQIALKVLPWAAGAIFAMMWIIAKGNAKKWKKEAEDEKARADNLADIVQENGEKEAKKTGIREDAADEQNDIRNSDRPHDDGLQNRTVRRGKYRRARGDDPAS